LEGVRGWRWVGVCREGESGGRARNVWDEELLKDVDWIYRKGHAREKNGAEMSVLSTILDTN
jgi:hypothetical protein